MKYEKTLLLILFVVSHCFARVPLLTIPIIFPDDHDLAAFFRCDDIRYIAKDFVCNGFDDCQDKTDEEFCVFSFETGEASDVTVRP